MSSAPLSIKLRCASWAQLASIHKRDLSRGALFLKSAATPPALGTPVQVDLLLPSATLITLHGVVHLHLAADDASGRGPGIDVKLAPIPPSAMWLIENALQSEQRVRAASDMGTPASPRAASVVAPLPGLADSADMTNAEEDLLAALTSELESLRRLNPFQVLGVGYESGDAEVRSAFGDLTKRYHPDRFARYQNEPLRKLAAEIFILIRDAYRRLCDVPGRATAMAAAGYVSSPRPVAAPRATTAPVPPVPPARATRAPSMNESVVRVIRPPTHNDTPLGAPLPRSIPPTPAPALQPLAAMPTERRPVLQPPPPLHGDARDQSSIDALLDVGKVADALAAYKVMAKVNPQDRMARAGVELCEGLQSLAAKDRLEAAQRFEAVLELDPSNERAARELAEMRRMATNERKGLLTKLMHAKD
ncbi:MAG: DnaJ domain-containing protein [Kofleriaceae bacterium]|nr:DnaJ domain-containing protein [Kofleriaceae bacterium]